MTDYRHYGYQDAAVHAVVTSFNEHRDVTDSQALKYEDVYVVWFSKTLKNFKALLSTTVSDGKYYEVTYNGEKDEMYVDTYVKLRNERHTGFMEDAI